MIIAPPHAKFMTALPTEIFISRRWLCRKATTCLTSRAAIEEAQLGKREDFLKVARSDTALIKDLDPQAPSLEGYLFPDTYHFHAHPVSA